MIDEIRTTLVVGADGVIGSALFQHLRKHSENVIGTTRHNGYPNDDKLYFDLERPDSFSVILRQPYKTAVICCGITSVQACQTNKERTRLINVDATIELIKMLAGAEVFIIFISSSLVYDGSLAFVDPKTPVCPNTEYGLQKCIVETYLLNRVRRCAVIRFGKVLEPTNHLFSEWYKNILANQEIFPFSDKYIAPITLPTAIEILSWLNHHQLQGLFQATACSEISYAEAALLLAKLAGRDGSLVKPIRSIDRDSLPVAHATLKTSKEITKLFGEFPPSTALEHFCLLNTSKR
jgi:dTDP-4-dehydrorhamnose reductase